MAAKMNKHLPAWIILGISIVLVLAGAARARAAARVQVYQSALTLYAYDWRAALVPTDPADPIYPYPRLDFDRVGAPADVKTDVVVLESAGTRVTIAPEYGGRILRWFDKTQQREVLYVNPVIKPTRWGYRGWWLATGGMEWCFPTNEHGLNEWRPWHYWTFSGDGYAGVTVYDRESRTGLDVSVTIVLYANERVSIRPRVMNKTGRAQHFQFWINAMLPYSPSARFELPARQVEVHSTGDASLPGPGQIMDWPVYQGRDFSRAAEWQQYLGVFAARLTRNRVAVVDPANGARLNRSFPPASARGVKLFLLGDLPSDLYTDDGSRYMELWGGYTRTFDEDAVIYPGATITWVEYWSTH